MAYLTHGIPRASCHRYSVLWNSSTRRHFSTIGPADYADRQRRFLFLMEPHSIVILPASDEVAYSHDILYLHRQDAMFRHLFGLSTPLHRMLMPPVSMTADVATATLAIFAKDCGGNTTTLLCVPPPTRHPSTVVWAAERVSLEEYARLLAPTSPRGLPQTNGQGHQSRVMENDVVKVNSALSQLIGFMVQSKQHQARQSSMSEPTTREVARSSKSPLLSLLPRLYAQCPSQLRWDGMTYRLANAPASVPPSRHPLAAFFGILTATHYRVEVPDTMEVGPPASRWQLATLRYTLPDRSGPGLPEATAVRASLRSPRLEGEGAVISLCNHSAKTSALSRPSDDDVLSHSDISESVIPTAIRPASALLWAYRAIKAPAQVRQHIRSAVATQYAFAQVFRCAAATQSEHQLHCTFQKSLLDISAAWGPTAQVRSAYIPVIAAGFNSIEIHYTDNSTVAAKAGCVVRVDAGAEVEGVPTDCTRSLPLGAAVFAPPLRQLYGALLKLQRKLLQAVAPGVSLATVAQLHINGTRQLLYECGIRGTDYVKAGSDSDEQLVSAELVRHCFCAHGFGHFFGLDIHEELPPSPLSPSDTIRSPSAGTAPTLRPSPRVFQPGMMHTVEPGVYIPDARRAELLGVPLDSLPAPLRGVGMQIEDDVLVLPSDDKAAAQNTVDCPWTRTAYLGQVLRAYALYSCEGDSILKDEIHPIRRYFYKHLQQLIPLSGTLPRHELVTLAFLFEQRVSISGVEVAVDCLSADCQEIKKLRFAPLSSTDGEGALLVPVDDQQWYPYHIVVVTAGIPKCMELMEATLGG